MVWVLLSMDKKRKGGWNLFLLLLTLLMEDFLMKLVSYTIPCNTAEFVPSTSLMT